MTVVRSLYLKLKQDHIVYNIYNVNDVDLNNVKNYSQHKVKYKYTQLFLRASLLGLLHKPRKQTIIRFLLDMFIKYMQQLLLNCQNCLTSQASV